MIACRPNCESNNGNGQPSTVESPPPFLHARMRQNRGGSLWAGSWDFRVTTITDWRPSRGRAISVLLLAVRWIKPTKQSLIWHWHTPMVFKFKGLSIHVTRFRSQSGTGGGGGLFARQNWNFGWKWEGGGCTQEGVYSRDTTVYVIY